jgi:hypothetical protein
MYQALDSVPLERDRLAKSARLNTCSKTKLNEAKLKFVSLGGADERQKSEKEGL